MAINEASSDHLVERSDQSLVHSDRTTWTSVTRSWAGRTRLPVASGAVGDAMALMLPPGSRR
jgi:hypothetical protein